MHLVTPPTETGPLSIAQCACCGSVYTREEWEALPTRRPWADFDLEIAECTGGAVADRDTCGSTISVEVQS